MKIVDATCFVEVACTCPYCDAFEDIFDDGRVKESMGDDHRADDCNIEIECSECGELFLVENIHF